MLRHGELGTTRVTNNTYRLLLGGQRYKFSCAHMTVFPDGTKERLHGHNYYISVTLTIADGSFSRMIPFARIKKFIKDLCEEWKEYVLLPEKNPYFKVVHNDTSSIEFLLCGMRYVLPKQDVKLLPLDNISVEQLSIHVADLLTNKIRKLPEADNINGLRILVEETPGQGADCSRDLHKM